MDNFSGFVRRAGRVVQNCNGFINLQTDAIEGVEFAYYLTTRDGIKKKFYSTDNSFTFDTPFSQGLYKATFFYKNGTEKKSEIIDFFINERGNFRYVDATNVVDVESYRIDFYDCKSLITFIVFNEAQTTKKTDSFELNYLLGKGYNVVACWHNGDHYQGLSYECFEKHVRPLVGDEKVFLHGSALGGYCAIYYAGAVNGIVIAARPMHYEHPDFISRNNNKSNVGSFRHKRFNDNRKTNGKIYLLYDPNMIDDVFFIKNIVENSYKYFFSIEKKYSGKSVLSHFKKTNQFDSIVSNIIEGCDPVLDLELDSAYSLMGKASYFFENKNYENGVFFSQKALEDLSIGQKTREKWRSTCMKYLLG